MTNAQVQVKEVNFQGDRLVAIQDVKSIIWASVRTICQNIGFSKNQIDNQIDKINNDLVLSKGAGNFPIPTNGGEQVTLCILIDFLPLWLAKISITPKMKKDNPKLVEKLITYQLKAKDVLAAAFLPTTYTSNPLLEQAMMSLQQSQQNLIDCTIEQGYQLSNHEERITQTEDDVAEVRDSFDNYLPAYKMDEIQEGFQEMDNRISVIENTSRIVLCEAEDRRFQGDEDTLSDDEVEARNASDLPSKEFAKWANDMVHKVSSKLKLGANCGNIWREAYKGLQLPNGKQISCLSELIDETYVSFRYIFALRLVKTLHEK